MSRVVKGLARVERLMNLELEHGFRSCFNFVPEGEYRVPNSLIEMLKNARFEVEIDGLKHDGKLYSSKETFAARAGHIRQYAKAWGSRGFRSPLMQHNLHWLHAVDANIDSSTFDTDPFEPEPDGFGTVFPFWVSTSNGGGYVELPYTLVQDLNLFEVLREQNIDIWKLKVDWVAEHGGMVLLNTHPDYKCFEGKRERDEYPVSLYEDFLRYVREKHDGAFWHALPADVARYYCDRLPVPQRNTRRKICMLAYSGYEGDNRIRRYAETLAKRGDQVDVISLSEVGSGGQDGEINGVAVYRVQKRIHNERSKWTYARRLIEFLVRSSILLTRLEKQNRYDVIHVHNMPDFLVFAAWYPKWAKGKIFSTSTMSSPSCSRISFRLAANQLTCGS